MDDFCRQVFPKGPELAGNIIWQGEIFYWQCHFVKALIGSLPSGTEILEFLSLSLFCADDFDHLEVKFLRFLLLILNTFLLIIINIICIHTMSEGEKSGV